MHHLKNPETVSSLRNTFLSCVVLFNNIYVKGNILLTGHRFNISSTF